MVPMSKEESSDAESSPAPSTSPGSQAGMHLVAIGASAGGLEALQTLLGNLAPGGSVAYVVAQHLSPDHGSLMVELLARVTALQVVEAVDGAALLPDTVSVCPPTTTSVWKGNG